MNKKLPLAAATLFALGSGSAMAGVGDPTQTIGIDWDGSGGFTEVGSLDWAVGSSWTDGSVNQGTYEGTITNPDGSTTTITLTADEATLFTLGGGGVVTCVSDCTFDLYTHAALASYTNDTGNPVDTTGFNTDFEWTFIAGLNEDTESINASFADTGNDASIGGVDYNILTAKLSFNFVMSDSGNTAAEGFFFEIYYDTTVDADSLSGQGYDDGQLILSATDLTFVSGDFTASSFNFVDLNGDGNFDVGEPVLTGDGDPWLNLDSFGTNNWADGTASATNPECDTNANAGTDGNCLSVQGTGGTQLEALVDQTTLDSNFFDPADFPLYFISDLVFSTQNVDPFLQTNPSGCYDTAAGSGSADDNCGGYVFGSIVNPDGSISNDVVNGSSSIINCALIADATDQAACFAAVTAGEDVMFQTDANQGFRTMRAVPEPGIMALLGLSLGLLGMSRRRRRS